MGIAPSAGQPSVSANNEELVRELNLITTKLQETESHLIAEREERDRKDKAVSVVWLVILLASQFIIFVFMHNLCILLQKEFFQFIFESFVGVMFVSF